jgi:hypothetical protein
MQACCTHPHVRTPHPWQACTRTCTHHVRIRSHRHGQPCLALSHSPSQTACQPASPLLDCPSCGSTAEGPVGACPPQSHTAAARCWRSRPPHCPCWRPPSRQQSYRSASAQRGSRRHCPQWCWPPHRCALTPRTTLARPGSSWRCCHWWQELLMGLGRLAVVPQTASQQRQKGLPGRP